jgi:hypothetical protein
LTRFFSSAQIVDFPFRNFDPTDYLAAVPQKTLVRYKELKLSGKFRSSCNTFVGCNGTITESAEQEGDPVSGDPFFY